MSFEGVVAISPSFADELFANVPEDTDEDGRVRFVDLDDVWRLRGSFVQGASSLTIRRIGTPP